MAYQKKMSKDQIIKYQRIFAMLITSHSVINMFGRCDKSDKENLRLCRKAMRELSKKSPDINKIKLIMVDIIKLMDNTFARGGIIPKVPENIISKY